MTIFIAKTTLSQPLARVEANAERLAASSLLPNLVPIHPVVPGRQFYALREAVSVNPKFFDPMTDDEWTAWSQ